LKNPTHERKRWTYYGILTLIQKNNQPKNIVGAYIKKSTLYDWLKRLQKEDYVTKSFQGFYELTDKGTQYLEWYESEDSKNQIRLENMRYKFPILNGIDNLINGREWDKIQQMNNDVIIYHTKEQESHVRLIAGKNNPCLEITCKQFLGLNIYELMYEAKEWVMFLAEGFQKDYSIVFGLPTPSMQPEWAIPSEFAKILLNKTNSSQIRTPKGVINKSKDREYDIETRDIRLANKIFDLPFVVDDILFQLKQLRASSNTGLFCF
jgi:DNA-binding PadR family transcriptional regulator